MVRHFVKFTASEKHGIFPASINTNHAQRPVGHGQENNC
jgi:hypothetical protein